MNQAETSVQRILVFHPEGDTTPDWIQSLYELGEVRVASTPESMLAALEAESFDLFVSASPEFVSPERMAANRQLGAVLDVIGQGLCIVDPSGQLAWCNARIKQFPEEVRERIRSHCADLYRAEEMAHETQRPRSLSLTVDHENYFDATIYPVKDPERGMTRLVAVISDVTRARRLQRKMDAIDNAGRELVRVDTDQLGRMDVPQRLELLESKIIRYTRELLDFDNFAVRLLDKQSNKLELVLSAGLLPEAEHIDIYASTENNGISGYVAATGRSYICPDVQKDPRYVIGIGDAHSSLTVPLWLHDHVIGVLNIESERTGAFSEDDRQFAEIFGRYVAIALHILDLMVVERYTATGRIADNVSSEIASPLSDILTNATTLMEDYIGHDDLRRRLQAITDSVARIKECIKQVAQPRDGILGSKPKRPECDPILDGKSVLVIDDEDIIRQTVHDVLTKFGCLVDTAREGNEALAILRQRRYDLVVSDIRMPGANGYEVFAAVKDANPDCPVIFMTGFGYDPHHSIIKARQEGLAAVLYKPFKVDQLLTDVRRAVTTAGS